MDAGARLERVLINFMLDLHTQRHGYREVLPPFLVNRDAMTGTGQLPKLEEDLFRVSEPDFFLIPTAEVPVTNIHREEMLEREQLPIRYVAYTLVFGAKRAPMGKMFAASSDSINSTRWSWSNLPSPSTLTTSWKNWLSMPRLCYSGSSYPIAWLSFTGDLSFAAAKTYDLEVWLPGQSTYRRLAPVRILRIFKRVAPRFAIARDQRQTHLCSHTQRLRARGWANARRGAGEPRKKKDGSVVIPEVLRSYMGGLARWINFC